MFKTFGIVAASSIAAFLLGIVVFPVAAAQINAVVTCNSNNPCAGGRNTGSGSGVTGAANTDGVFGLTTNEDSSKNYAGVFGYDTAKNTSNAGVHGASVNGDGVYGFSAHDYGITGETKSTTPAGRAGILGLDSSTSRSNSAVYGVSQNGQGVSGLSLASSGTGVKGQGKLFGIYGQQSAGGSGGAAVGASGDPAFAAYPPSNNTQYNYVGTASVGGITFSVTPGGVVYASTYSSPNVMHTFQKAATGARVVTYAPQVTTPAVEDFGEATLSGGFAYVRFDARLAAIIDSRTSYMVFVTPQGPVAGTLYVTGKSAQGFAVRESNGRSNAAFDYRIVARPFGVQAARLPDAPLPPGRAVLH